MDVLLSDSHIRNYQMMPYRFIGKDITGIARARAETQKSTRSRPPGAVIGAIERQGIVETVPPVLDTLLGYIPR